MGTVRFETEGRQGTLTLESPRGNALDPEMLEAIERHLRALDPNTTRVVVLRGAGEKSFSSGYNVQELAKELAAGPSVSDEANHPLERALRALDECPVPTIALLHGYAFGAGCELAATADLRIAADDASFCMPPAKLGILYSASGLRRFVELVGMAVTKELFFTGEAIDAARALAVGLVNAVHPKARATEAALEVAATIAANAPLSVRHTKTLLNRHLRPAPLGAEATAAILRLREECFRSQDFRRAAAAFLEKKGPVEFEGR
jgi:enoyl-CoA hydratase/carnithine racemase